MVDEATFAAGCFWGVEHEFRKIDGVLDAICGYTGGHTDNPTYRDVCGKGTGHAEVVKVTFDPARVSFEQLTEAFFNMHDPTQLNRQGPDVGDQYRSAIFYHNDAQKEAAEKIKQRIDSEGRFSKPIVTKLEKAVQFFKAEEYHQRYFEKTGIQACH